MINALAPVLSGVLSALSLPAAFDSFKFPDLGFLAWVSLVPLYLVLRTAGSLRKGFWLGLAWGIAFYGVSLYWIFIAMHTYGEIPVWGSLLGLAASVLIESLFSAAACGLAAGGSRRGIPLFILFPLAWVIQDFARTYIPFGGNSWASLVYTQRSFLSLLQILDLTGIYGIIFLLALSNALAGEVWLCLRKRRSFPTKLAASFLILFLTALVYGRSRLFSVKKDLASRETMKISLVQGNIPQEEKWLEEKIEEIIARHLVLSEEAENPDLIVWPEAAYPAVVPPEIIQIDFFKDLKVPLLAGVVSYEGRIPLAWPPDPDEKSFALYNSAFLFEPGGYIAGRYHKNHLVPMGEYVPLGRFLFFLNRIVPSISSFTPGKELNLLTLTPDPSPASGRGELPQAGDTMRVRAFGVTICYEDLFPGISRSFTRRGADFLVNLTNDAWYERSSAVYQHFDFSRYRAVENRRSMVRATNTGVTGFFLPTGEVLASAPLFTEAVLAADVPLGGPVSFYTRFGDLFAWGCLLGYGLLMGGTFVRRQRGQGNQRTA